MYPAQSRQLKESGQLAY